MTPPPRPDINNSGLAGDVEGLEGLGALGLRAEDPPGISLLVSGEDHVLPMQG